MPRRQRERYRQTSEEERQALVDAHLSGEDYLAVATRLRLKRGTAWSIIARYLRRGDVTSRPRGGRTTNKLDDESRDLLVMCLEDEPQLTLKQLAPILQETWPEKPSVSSSTISRALHGGCITIKKVIPQPAERNSDRVKEARHEFASWMMTTGLARHRVYIDESGFNIHLMRTRGRAPAGTRAVRTVCGSRGRNISFITAISNQYPDGIIYHEVVEGRVNQGMFAGLIQSISAIIGEDTEVTMLFDNAPSHRDVKTRVHLLNGHHLKRLPAYSPFLNPIENVFSVMKATTKQHLAANQHRLDDRVAAARAGATLTDWRRNISAGPNLTKMGTSPRPHHVPTLRPHGPIS